jgi:demethylmenaquinone methyltransferase / 2-methoxy-6-polyprenyl-1,4-benzoquinol methylase
MALDKSNLSGFFSNIAPNYDFLNQILSFNSDKSWRKKLINGALSKDDAKVLDLCTGTAEIAIEFARKESSSQVYGIDFSMGMLKKAKEKIDKLGLQKRIRLAGADVFALPFKAETFDTVSISFGLRNLVDYRKGLIEITKMVKNGGQIIILEFSPPAFNAFGRIVDLYIAKIIPLIARLFGGRLDAYKYLSLSIRTFLYPGQILRCMESAGLKNLYFQKINWGVINCYYGEK